MYKQADTLNMSKNRYSSEKTKFYSTINSLWRYFFLQFCTQASSSFNTSADKIGWQAPAKTSGQIVKTCPFFSALSVSSSYFYLAASTVTISTALGFVLGIAKVSVPGKLKLLLEIFPGDILNRNLPLRYRSIVCLVVLVIYKQGTWAWQESFFREKTIFVCLLICIFTLGMEWVDALTPEATTHALCG